MRFSRDKDSSSLKLCKNIVTHQQMHKDYTRFLHLPKCSESPLQSTVDSNQNAGFCDFVFCKLIGRAATCQQMLQFPVQILPQLVDTIIPASLVLKHKMLTDSFSKFLGWVFLPFDCFSSTAKTSWSFSSLSRAAFPLQTTGSRH